MSSTNFIDGTTVITAEWLNETNAVVYDVLGDGVNPPANTAAAKVTLGINNVDNTSDVNKPVSTAQQTALNLKANAASPSTSGTLTHSGDVVFSAGNVGIGVSPSYKLHVANSSVDANNVLTGSGLVIGSGLALREKGATAGIGGTNFPVQIISGASYGNLELYSTSVSYGLVFGTNSTERMRIDANGNVIVTSPAGLGYGAGAGGTVTQATSKSTAVTLNKPCGQITMHNAALAAGVGVSFNLNNSIFDAANDCMILTGNDFAYNYRLEVTTSASNQVRILVTNTTAGSLSEAVKIRFAIIKGAIS